jgi:competence protein ComEA
MKKINIVIVLAILVIIIAFLLGFSVAKSQNDKNINQNTNTININPNKIDKKININTADKNELMSIKGIGDRKADLIISNRPYKSVWDLSSVKGINESFVKEIEEEITVD